MSELREMVFVISADRLVQIALEQALSAERMHTTMFESAAEFLAYPRPDAPACLVLDVVTADRNGLDLQQQLAGRDIPVVFVTQQPEISNSVQAIKAGALDFFTLPLPKEEVLRAIRSGIALDTAARERRRRSRQMWQRLETLSPREIEVLAMTLDGMACKQMAGALGISECTAQTHRRRVMRKLQTDSIPELVRLAEALGVASESALHRHAHDKRAPANDVSTQNIFSTMRSRDDRPSWGGSIDGRHGS